MSTQMGFGTHERDIDPVIDLLDEHLDHQSVTIVEYFELRRMAYLGGPHLAEVVRALAQRVTTQFPGLTT